MNVGDILRCRSNPNDFWRVQRMTAKSAYLVRCGANGTVSEYAKEWIFRLDTISRDFFPAWNGEE